MNTVWISHSAIRNFDNCPRLYYYTNIYRNPKTGNRVQIANPYISLGLAVHETIEELIDLSPTKRNQVSLTNLLDKKWLNYQGKFGGFVSPKQEKEFKKRGVKMVKKVEKSQIISKKALKREENLPQMKLFDGVSLVGSFDWVEVLPNNNLHIIDFKTGRSKESPNSLQLPIYELLAQNNYQRKVEKLSYWYLESNTTLTSKTETDPKTTLKQVKEKAVEIKSAIDNSSFSCGSSYPRCFWCRKYESVVSGRAEWIKTDEERGKDIYYLVDGGDVIKKVEESGFLNEEESLIFKMRMENEDIDKIKKESKKSSQEIKNSVSSIKKKVKKNLSNKELKIFVEELAKNGNQLEL